MNQETAHSFFKARVRNRPKGEPFVWFTAMGLTIGVVMIVGLLAVIAVEGTSVFWPNRLVMIKFKEGSRSASNETGILAGQITKTQKKIKAQHDSVSEGLEWQLFLGNKDLFGANFKFIDADEIEKVSYPENLMRIIRLEYGDAIAFPVALKLKTGKLIEVNDPLFLGQLGELVKTARERWGLIRDIEKKKIGKINFRMDQIRMKTKGPHEEKKSQVPASGNEELKQLESQYGALAAQARELRALQKESYLIYKTANGLEKELAAGQIIRFYFPNQMSFWERAHYFLFGIWEFLTEEPREANTEGGVFPAIFGTFVMTVLMSMAVTPFGVLAAIYLREYAKQGFFVRCVRIAINNLAGVPSIVFGVFGLGFFVYLVGGSIDQLFFSARLPTPTFGTGGVLWASLTLALLTVPVVIVAAEEAISAVPRGMKEGSLACGASKWQTIYQIVLPASAPGILTGLILAMARGASEVAPLMLVGVVKLAPTLPLDSLFPFLHLERKFMHLGFHIYDLGFQSPDSEAAKPMVFATTLLLITLVVILNLAAVFIRDRLRKKFMVGAF